MALAHPGFVQKVMGKVMPQSWAVRRNKVTQKSPTQRSQALNERPDSALYPPLPVSAVKRRRAARRKGAPPTHQGPARVSGLGGAGADGWASAPRGCAGKLGLC